MTVSQRWTIVKKDVEYQRQTGSSRLNISPVAVLPLDAHALSDPVVREMFPLQPTQHAVENIRRFGCISALRFAEAFGNNLLSCLGPKLLKLPHGAALSFML